MKQRIVARLGYQPYLDKAAAAQVKQEAKALAQGQQMAIKPVLDKAAATKARAELTALMEKPLSVHVKLHKGSATAARGEARAIISDRAMPVMVKLNRASAMKARSELAAILNAPIEVKVKHAQGGAGAARNGATSAPAGGPASDATTKVHFVPDRASATGMMLLREQLSKDLTVRVRFTDGAGNEAGLPGAGGLVVDQAGNSVGKGLAVRGGLERYQAPERRYDQNTYDYAEHVGTWRTPGARQERSPLAIGGGNPTFLGMPGMPAAAGAGGGAGSIDKVSEAWEGLTRRQTRFLVVGGGVVALLSTLGPLTAAAAGGALALGAGVGVLATGAITAATALSGLLGPMQELAQARKTAKDPWAVDDAKQTRADSWFTKMMFDKTAWREARASREAVGYATVNLGLAQRSMNDTYRDGTRQLEDLNRQLELQKLNQEGLSLSAVQSRVEYERAKVQFQRGEINNLELAIAKNRYETSLKTYQQGEVDTQRAIEDTARVRRRGLSGMTEVIQGTMNLVQAMRAQRDAETEVKLGSLERANEERQVNYQRRKALRETAATLGNTNPLLARLDKMMGEMPGGRRFLNMLDKELYPAMGKIRNMAIAGLLPGLSEGFSDISGKAEGIGRVFQKFNQAVGETFSGGIKRLINDPTWKLFWDNLEEAGPKGFKDLTGAFGDMFTGVAALMNKYRPDIERMMDTFGGAMDDFANWAAGDGGDKFIDWIRENLPVVVGNIKDFGVGMVDLLHDLEPLGRTILRIFGSIGDTLSFMHTEFPGLLNTLASGAAILGGVAAVRGGAAAGGRLLGAVPGLVGVRGGTRGAAGAAGATTRGGRVRSMMSRGVGAAGLAAVVGSGFIPGADDKGSWGNLGSSVAMGAGVGAMLAGPWGAAAGAAMAAVFNPKTQTMLTKMFDGVDSERENEFDDIDQGFKTRLDEIKAALVAGQIDAGTARARQVALFREAQGADTDGTGATYLNDFRAANSDLNTLRMSLERSTGKVGEYLDVFNNFSTDQVRYIKGQVEQVKNMSLRRFELHARDMEATGQFSEEQLAYLRTQMRTVRENAGLTLTVAQDTKTIVQENLNPNGLSDWWDMFTSPDKEDKGKSGNAFTSPSNPFLKGLSGQRAYGGSVFAGQSYLVGERSAEVFTPAMTGTITPMSRVSPGSATLPTQGNTRTTTVEQHFHQPLDSRSAALEAQRAVQMTEMGAWG